MTVPASRFPLPERQRVTGHWDGARAVDFPTALGTPWLAVFSGTTRPYHSGIAGNALYLLSDDGTTTAYYGHGQADPDTRVIGAVSPGQTIGNVGMTGMTSGPHLHFAITNDRVVTWQGGGTIDPADYLTNGVVSAPVNVVANTPPVVTDPIAASAPTAPQTAPPVPGLARAFTEASTLLPATVRPFAPLVALGAIALIALVLLDD